MQDKAFFEDLVRQGAVDFKRGALGRREFWESLQQCLAHLSPKMASAFTLRELEGLAGSFLVTFVEREGELGISGPHRTDAGQQVQAIHIIDTAPLDGAQVGVVGIAPFLIVEQDTRR